MSIGTIMNGNGTSNGQRAAEAADSVAKARKALMGLEDAPAPKAHKLGSRKPAPKPEPKRQATRDDARQLAILARDGLAAENTMRKASMACRAAMRSNTPDFAPWTAAATTLYTLISAVSKLPPGTRMPVTGASPADVLDVLCGRESSLIRQPARDPDPNLTWQPRLHPSGRAPQRPNPTPPTPQLLLTPTPTPSPHRVGVVYPVPLP